MGHERVTIHEISIFPPMPLLAGESPRKALAKMIQYRQVTHVVRDFTDGTFTDIPYSYGRTGRRDKWELAVKGDLFTASVEPLTQQDDVVLVDEQGLITRRRDRAAFTLGRDPGDVESIAVVSQDEDGIIFLNSILYVDP